MINEERYTDFFRDLKELLGRYGHRVEEIQSISVAQGGTTIVKFVVEERFEHGYRPAMKDGQKVLKAEYIPSMKHTAEED